MIRLPPGLPVQVRTQCAAAPVLVCVEAGHRFDGKDLQALVDEVLRLGNGRSAMVVMEMPAGTAAAPNGCFVIDCPHPSTASARVAPNRLETLSIRNNGADDGQSLITEKS